MLHAKNRGKLPHGIMGRLHNSRLVGHTSPGKASQAVQFKPPFQVPPYNFVFDYHMACIIVYVVVNFLSQVIFVFLLFLGMVMLLMKLKQKKNKNYPR